MNRGDYRVSRNKVFWVPQVSGVEYTNINQRSKKHDESE